MKKTLLFVLTLSVSIKGLSALSANIIREYHYVKQLKTWAEAQSYCRDKFTDLATVDNQDDNDRLQSVLKDGGQKSWIGLCDDMTGWKWALGNADFDNEFSKWEANEPNKRNSNGACAVMTSDGFWRDKTCGSKKSAVCYYEQGPAKYILVQTKMTWYQAKTYCRSSYTDLVSVRNMSENNQISSLVSEKTWIGLHRKPWAYWSDKTPRTFTNWHTGQPDDQSGMKACTTIEPKPGEWWDNKCERKFHFICQTVHYPQHKTTFKLKFQSEANLNDPAVQQQILEQLHGKLEKHGLPDFKLRWIQTDGKTFQKEQERKKKKGSCG